MPFPILETERLKLVEITTEHVNNVYQLFSNPLVTQYYGMSPFTSEEQAETMIQSFSKGWEEKRSIRWGITQKLTGEWLGTVGFNNVSMGHKRAEVGYDLEPAHWNSGYVTEAVAAIVQYGLGEFEFNRIGAVTFPENIASQRVLEKLGFQKEGVLRQYMYQDGKSHDAFVFSIVKEGL